MSQSGTLDLKNGIPIDRLRNGEMIGGQVDGQPVLLARQDDQFFALDSVCTHYGAPLADGLLVGDTIRCHWHHACFSLRTGEALRAPALDPLSCWRLEKRAGIVCVTGKLPRVASPAIVTASKIPKKVAIIGGGAAGVAAAQMLRHEGYGGSIAMLSADRTLPCDRPNLSKGFLAGSSPASANPLRPAGFYHEHHIDLRLNTRVIALDTKGNQLQLADGATLSYDALLLAMGAEPVRLRIPGAERRHVHYLRTWADAEALVEKALHAKRAVVVGASFIGLEVAASLRARGLFVAVVAPEAIPMARILGPEVGGFIQKMHEIHGVGFHLGTTLTGIGENDVTLANGKRLEADLVVIGVGVRPAIGLAEAAGITTDRGVVVDAYLETSIPGVFAAGDIALWPDPLTSKTIRIEHWVVAERQGQVAARNILGQRERFDQVPFFWTEQYDFGLSYTGHAEEWDELQLDGDLTARNCLVRYNRAGETLAVAAIGRDRDGLIAELEFERRIAQQQVLGGAGR